MTIRLELRIRLVRSEVALMMGWKQGFLILQGRWCLARKRREGERLAVDDQTVEHLIWIFINDPQPAFGLSPVERKVDETASSSGV